jgi:hypothetical protein
MTARSCGATFLLLATVSAACGGTEKPPVDTPRTLPPADPPADVSDKPAAPPEAVPQTETAPKN